jgi:DNA-binding LacI/PurR family transcriptional regulator
MGKVIEKEVLVSEQVAEYVKRLIVRRALKRGATLPSYRELAAELNVAVPTVKRGVDVLASQGIVRRQRRQGCFVNKSLSPRARALKHVGLIYPSGRYHLFTDSYLTEIMRGVTQAAPPRSDMHIFSMREEGLVDAAQLGEWAVDGAILLGMENDDYLRAFATWGTPGVVVDYCPRDVPLDYVACDNAAAVKRMVEHLATLGHRRVACLAQHPQSPVVDPRDTTGTLLVRDSSDVRERREETLRALQGRDMLAGDFCPSERDPEWPVHAAQAVVQWLHGPDRPTALLADNDMAAARIVKELGNRGIRVPQDISVCAVSGTSEFARHEPVRIAYCRFDFVGMGRKAVELLADRCRQTASAEPRGERIGFEFVEGETVRTLSKT